MEPDEEIAARLLGDGDPAPVEVLRPDAGSPFVLTAEHAGKAIPKRLGTLGLSGRNLDRHIAWDIGIAGVTRRLSEKLDAPAVLQNYSRLVVDCNRWPTARDFVTAFSEDTMIPGNVGLMPGEIEARAREIFHPYHDTIRDLLDLRIAAARPTVLVAMHSCTPVYLGVSRPWHVGVLYDKDPTFARILLELLHGEGKLIVGDNEPYFLTSDKDYAVPVHGEQRGIPHVEIEIRQDLIQSESGQTEWAERMAEVFGEGLGRLREAGGI
ncbi:MAG TPA: N-formylglutamate amidohydrolase [Gammaproteobacteria bacterium]|nr:N-formylglutamate amidohydrolase [Gammaproteobacteria bacterium]